MKQRLQREEEKREWDAHVLKDVNANKDKHN